MNAGRPLPLDAPAVGRADPASRSHIVAEPGAKRALCGVDRRSGATTWALRVQDHIDGHNPAWCPACLDAWRGLDGKIIGDMDDARIADRDWCAARLAAGDTVAAIGAAAGVSRQTASGWLKRHGLQPNHQRKTRPTDAQLEADYARTGSIRRQADEYGISSAVMRTWLFEAGVDLGARGRPTVDVDVDDVRARRARGESWSAIADEVGVSATALRRHAEGVD